MSHLSDVLASTVNIFVAPVQAFRSLRQRPSIWFPLLLIVVAWIALWNWYYSAVDYRWVVDHLITLEQAKVPADQHEAIATNLNQLKPGAFVIISIFTVLLILVVVSVVTSLYLLIVSAIYDDKVSLKHWYSFALWSSMPSLLLILAMVLNFIMVGTHQIAPEQLNPLTLNHLFFQVSPDNKFFTLLSSIDLVILWSWVLMIIGYREWTGRSWMNAAAIILTPWVIVYGIWFAVVAMK